MRGPRRTSALSHPGVHVVGRDDGQRRVLGHSEALARGVRGAGAVGDRDALVGRLDRHIAGRHPLEAGVVGHALEPLDLDAVGDVDDANELRGEAALEQQVVACRQRCVVGEAADFEAGRVGRGSVARGSDAGVDGVSHDGFLGSEEVGGIERSDRRDIDRGGRVERRGAAGEGGRVRDDEKADQGLVDREVRERHRQERRSFDPELHRHDRGRVDEETGDVERIGRDDQPRQCRHVRARGNRHESAAHRGVEHASAGLCQDTTACLDEKAGGRQGNVAGMPRLGLEDVLQRSLVAPSLDGLEER